MTNVLTTLNKAATGLTDAAIRKMAPSVFAKHPYQEGNRPMSESYLYIPTIDVVNKLRSEGFIPVNARQQGVRVAGKANYTRHELRFMLPTKAKWEVNDTRPEIVLVNSHDGSSMYRISAGLYRLICSNGMVTFNHDFGTYQVRHTGDILADVIEASYRVIEDVPKIEAKVKEFTSLKLTIAQQAKYTEMALGLRWEKGHSPIEPMQLLEVRRPEDVGNNLWLTYQRTQENLIQGGMVPEKEKKDRNGRKVKSISSIKRDYVLNRDLWQLTEEFAGKHSK